MGIKILGTGSFTPDKIVTNKDLEKIVDTNDEWITTRTGIKQRHVAEDDVACSDLALEAAKNALEMANISAEDIDLIVLSSISGDQPFPSTACILQGKLGATNAVAFDVMAACAGYVYSFEVASSMLLGSQNYKRALVIGAEKMTSIVDWKDRNTCVLFGDGAAAIIIEKTEGDETALISSKIDSNGSYSHILGTPAGGSAMPASQETLDNREGFLRMEGQEVYKQAVKSMVAACKDALEKANLTTDDIKWFIPHQANYRILKAVGTRLKFDMDKIYINVDKYGNTSAASIGIALDEIVRGNKIEKGDKILLTAFGGGLTWGAMLLEW